MSGKVAVIMGSKSDADIMKKAADALSDFGIENDTFVISAHRTPEAVAEFSKNAEKNGYEVIIAGAGGAAHLAGVIASFTALPVIGVPVKSAALSGMDSLLAMVQMPGGVPVATVAIDGAKNAGILAAQILAVKYPELREAVKEHKNKLASAGAVKL
ncbi:MAG: 5-(carboxyamino)imidazole ribonucleotide mutase [Abditibacteriota bacterium]|nr:5-(carboxyamino)imidazole ribonucleotide mutase [Abditibacteriota bacterium]